MRLRLRTRARSVLNVLWAIGTLTLLFWVYRTKPDTTGEMFCDMDLIEGDDPGEDVDEA